MDPSIAAQCAAGIAPSLNLLLIDTIWSAFLVPIAIALFYFSTSQTRRQPMFIMNTISLGAGLAQGALGIYMQTRLILAQPLAQHFDLAFIVMSLVGPQFSELILLIRVHIVYPIRLLPPLRRLAIYGPIAAFKLARLVIDVLYSIQFISVATAAGSSPIVTAQTVYQSPYMKVAAFLQLADNAFTSMLFLLKLRESIYRGDSFESSQSTEDGGSYYARLKALFWIATSNFVFPTVLCFARLVLLFSDKDQLNYTYLWLVNNYVQIIGVLLATVWSSSIDSVPTRAAVPPSANTLRFATHVSADTASLRSRAGRGSDDTLPCGEVDGSRFGLEKV